MAAATNTLQLGAPHVVQLAVRRSSDRDRFRAILTQATLGHGPSAKAWVARDGRRLLAVVASARESQDWRRLANCVDARFDVWPAVERLAGWSWPSDGGEIVISERHAPWPVAESILQTLDERCAWCFDANNVTMVQALSSFDRHRLVSIYHAPDAESLRRIERGLRFPSEHVWTAAAPDN